MTKFKGLGDYIAIFLVCISIILFFVVIAMKKTSVNNSITQTQYYIRLFSGPNNTAGRKTLRLECSTSSDFSTLNDLPSVPTFTKKRNNALAESLFSNLTFSRVSAGIYFSDYINQSNLEPGEYEVIAYLNYDDTNRVVSNTLSLTINQYYIRLNAAGAGIQIQSSLNDSNFNDTTNLPFGYTITIEETTSNTVLPNLTTEENTGLYFITGDLGTSGTTYNLIAYVNKGLLNELVSNDIDFTKPY